jgi:glycosyltransferase involved in cell wall biosynthesis
MVSSGMPIVSIITPTRNRPEWLAKALRAMASQTFQDFEAIVIDDGSDAGVIDAYGSLWASLDSRFILERPPVPGAPGTGPAAARNRGLQRAQGEFVAFCDDDDYWRIEDHLAVGVEALQRADADIFFANLQGERKDGTVVVPDWFFGSGQLTAGLRVLNQPAVHEVALPSLLAAFRHYYPSLDTFIVRERLVRKVGGLWERLRCGEDMDFILRLVDQARRILYRPECAASANCNPRNHECVRHSVTETRLQHILLSQHVRMVCCNGLVRRCARSMESWNYRAISQDLLGEGRTTAALSLAWLGFSVYPNLGSAAFLARVTGRAVVHRFGARCAALHPPSGVEDRCGLSVVPK